MNNNYLGIVPNHSLGKKNYKLKSRVMGSNRLCAEF